MVIRMRKGTNVHLQGHELPTMEEEKKEKAKNSLSFSHWTTNTQQGGLCDILEISTRNFCKRCILDGYIYMSIIQCMYICIYSW